MRVDLNKILNLYNLIVKTVNDNRGANSILKYETLRSKCQSFERREILKHYLMFINLMES